MAQVLFHHFWGGDAMTKTAAIINAAKRGNLKLVESRLAAGDDVEARDEYGYTPLLAASEKGRLAVVQLLLQHGASVHALSEGGESALTLAANSHHGDIVRLLLERGAEPNIVPHHQLTSLAAAARYNDWALCELLLASGAGIDLLHEWGSALSSALDWGHEDLACRLIERGADVDCPRGQYAPVVIAAREGLLRMLGIILERTRLDFTDEVFTLAMAEAADREQEDAVDLLLARGCLPDLARAQLEGEDLIFPLYTATVQGHVGIVGKLLAHGAKVSASGLYGSALTAAAEHGHREIVDLLLAHGADITQIDIYDHTALGWALHKENPKITESLMNAGAMPPAVDLDAALLVVLEGGNEAHAQLLLDAGASPNAAFTPNGLPLAENRSREDFRRRLNRIFGDDEDAGGDERSGTTALMLAAENRSLPLIELLLARGADVLAQNRQGETALMLAADSGSPDVVRRLLDAGARVDPQSSSGWTAMHSAAGNADPAILDLLHQHGGDIRQADHEEWTPLLSALRNNCSATARRLIELGADFRTPCKDGYTALMAAARGECLELLDFLVAGGVDIHARWTETDLDALMLAANNGLLAVVEKLLALGANPLAVNRKGESASTLARQEGHEAVSLLLSNLGADPGALPALGKGFDPDACRRLVAQLQSCLPELDAAPLLANLPESSDEVMSWLYDELSAQELMGYAEWKDYWGDLPELRVFGDIDMSAYDPQAVIDLVEKHGFPSGPEEIPYFEYQNHFLKKHGRRMLTLAEENIHMFCVRDDPDAISTLDQCLKEFGIRVIDHPPLTLRQCAKAIKDAQASQDDFWQ